MIESKEAYELQEHLNAVLRAIRGVNQLITREKDPERLLKGACDCLIETRGYHNAWIAIFDEGGRLVTTAEARLGESFMLIEEQLKRGKLTDCGQRALRQSEVEVIEDPAVACADCPLSAKYGGRGAMTARLEHGGKVYGLLSVSIPAELIADEEEQTLFKEVAGDIAFALHRIELEGARTRAEEALHESEKDWRDSFNSLDDVMLIIDRDYNIENINEIGLNLLGKSKEEVIGQKCYQVISGADSPGEDCPCMKSLETKRVESTDRYEARFGKYFAIKSSPMLDENGEVIKFVDIRRDISERKRAEDALRASEKWLSTTLRSIDDAVIATDAQGLVSIMNPVAEILTGWYEAEALGKPLEDVFNIINEQTGAQAENPVARVLREGVVVGLANHTVLIAKDETKRPIADSGAPIIDAEGSLIGTVMVFRDITERRMMEEALHKQMYVLGERVKELNCFYNISELVETPGNSLEELLRGSLSIIPPAWRYPEITCVRITIGDQEFKTENFLETNWKLNTDILVGEKRVGTLEVCYLEERPQSDEGPFLNEERSLLDAIAERLGRIIERKRAEEERERLYQELEAKSKELEQMVYVASHDLRSPLVNVQGFSKELDQSVKELSSALQREDIPTAIKEEVIPILDEDIPEALQYIHTSTSKMDSLLSGLLRLSRLGRAALTIEKLDMNTLMSDIAGAFEFQLKDKDAELVIGSLPPCRGDKMQINQVFSNLLDNALKYLDPNRPGVIKITGQEDKRQSIYCIEDNGVGIAPEHQAKIFEIFQQLDPSTTTGEGLGLTIVWQILDRHNGRIWLESEPGKGSKFFVALPTYKK